VGGKVEWFGFDNELTAYGDKKQRAGESRRLSPAHHY
jgi:hypothetical protein